MVPKENLCASEERTLIEIGRQENRCLAIADLDFANPLVSKPKDYASITVRRLPSRPTAAYLLDTI